VEARELSRSFGGRRAVERVSFALGEGECLALFGPNGAGKTTLLRMLAGLIRPTSGSATIAGVQIPGGPEARGAVGIISHRTMLYAALSARENIEFSARLHRVRHWREATQRVLELMRIADRAGLPVRALSRGMQQRVSIARALVHEPRVLLLDEPFTGLDEGGSVALSGMLHELRGAGAAMVLVTHNLAEGLALADRVVVMRAGRLASEQRREEVQAEEFGRRYRELVAGD
jgi:heme exporter protein A